MIHDVAICLSTYNGEKYLHSLMSSILSQTYDNFAFYIRDDGSNDRTIEILEDFAFKDDRIILISDSLGNLGFKKSFERIMLLTKERYIFLSDQDDIWMPNKIEVIRNKLISGLHLVHHDAFILHGDKAIDDSLYLHFHFKPILNYIMPNYVGCCMAFDRELLELCLPFCKWFPGHDVWIGLLGQNFYATVYTKEKLIMLRRHGNNTSSLLGKSKNSFFSKMLFRVHYIIDTKRHYFRKKLSLRNVIKGNR